MATTRKVSVIGMLIGLLCMTALIVDVILGHAGEIYVPSEGSIQAGIDAASNGDTVIVAAGTYYESLAINNKNLTLKGAGPNATIVDQSEMGGRCLTISDSSTVNIEGFTFQNGNSSGDLIHGGGIFVSYSSVTITNSAISTNWAEYGGGIYVTNSNAILNECTLLENAATWGGGIGIENSSSVTISDSTFSANTSWFFGGGIYVRSGSTANVINNVFSGNSSEGGGAGIDVRDAATNVTNSTLSGNNSPDGAMHVYNGTASVVNSVFTGNVGLGLYVWESTALVDSCTFSSGSYDNENTGLMISRSTVILNNCSLYDNSGGGVTSDGSTVTVTNCTFSNNYLLAASSGGAGISNWGGSLTITNSTFFNNYVGDPNSEEGGGIWNDGGSLNITNSIIWGNFPHDLEGCSATYSLVGTGSTAGEGNISVNPQFVDPAGRDFRLQVTSPCIDAGSNAAPQLPVTDLEGNPRIVDGNGDGIAVVDMGAYEYAPPNTPSGSNVTVPLGSGVTVTFANVTVSGLTTVSTAGSGPPLPAEFSLGDPPIYYDIKTTATYTPPVTVCISYDPAQYSDLNNLHLFHYENNTWTDVTTSNDRVGNIICGEVNSFSLFVIGMRKVIYNFSGFFRPVENPPVLNVVNAGRAIPIKFSLGGDYGLEIFAAGYPASASTTCGTTTENSIEEAVTAGSSSLSYDTSTDEYNYVWKTDGAWAGSCRTFVLKLKDGAYRRANFRFK